MPLLIYISTIDVALFLRNLLIAGFLSTATGTSVGTIAVTCRIKVDLSLPLISGARWLYV
jgi:hypothetical protein